MPKSLYLLPLLAVLGAGCASGPKPQPAVPESEARSGAELIRLGREAAQRGDSVRAEQYLTLAIDEGADRELVLPVLLAACLGSSHLRAALNHAEPYLLDHPDDDRLRYLVATIHLGLGQVVAAKRDLNLLLQRNDKNAEAHFLLGIIESSLDIGTSRQHFLAVLRFSRDDEQLVEANSRLNELRLRESVGSP